MPDSCVICRRIPTKESMVSLHRFPPKSQIEMRKKWLKALNLSENDLTGHHKVCSRHFQNGDASLVPTLFLGRKFQSPKKRDSRRSSLRSTSECDCTGRGESSNASPSSQQVTPMDTDIECGSDSSIHTRMSTPIGETLLSTSDYSVFELPDVDNSSLNSQDTTNTVIKDAILPRLRALENEKQNLVAKFECEWQWFRIENISHSDSLVHFYSGFRSYEQLLLFYEFLGPTVNHLKYWERTTSRKRQTKLSALNQLFLTLVKLKLNLRERDIAYRFWISQSTVSKYFITWVCFLYHHLSEIDWRPSPEQVRRTLPQAFRDKYCDTYIILDATEIFLQTPCDLQNQSSTWSSYKHHNTGNSSLDVLQRVPLSLYPPCMLAEYRM